MFDFTHSDKASKPDATKRLHVYALSLESGRKRTEKLAAKYLGFLEQENREKFFRIF